MPPNPEPGTHTIQKANYVRLYVDDNGGSHLEDLDISLASVDFAPLAGPLNVAQFLQAKQIFWVGFPAGWAGETPHPSPQRQIMVVLQGELEAIASDGDVRRLGPGGVILMEDTWGKGHSTRVIGNDEALVFAVVLADPQ